MSKPQRAARYAVWRAACLGLAMLGALVASFSAFSSLSAGGELKIGPLHGSLLLGGLMLLVIGVEAARHVREAQDAVALFRHYRTGLLLWSTSQALFVILVIAYRRFGPGHAMWFPALLIVAAGMMFGLLLIIGAKLIQLAEELRRFAERLLALHNRLAAAHTRGFNRIAQWTAPVRAGLIRLGAPGRILLLGWLLIPYGVYHYVTRAQLDLGFSRNYSDAFRQWAILAALILLLGALRAASSSSPQHKQNPPQPSLWRSWFASFLPMLGIVLGIFLYVDPHARFAAHRFPPVTPGARLEKPEMYRALEAAPEIVILGSSRAFTLSPEYLLARTGHTAFNMSLEGAVSQDFEIQLNFLLHRPKTPRLLIIEFSEGYLQLSTFRTIHLQPLMLLPYLPPEVVPGVLNETLSDSFSAQGLADSIFLLTMPDVEDRLMVWTFESDGMGVRQPVSPELYAATMLIPAAERFRSVHQCDDLRESSKPMFEKTLNLALQNNIGIVVYRSPLNRAYLEQLYAVADPNKLARCGQVVNDYLESLAATYPNVFVRDLWDYGPVTDLEEAGYYDQWHPRPRGAQAVIDTLLPQIQAAWQWTLEHPQPTLP